MINKLSGIVQHAPIINIGILIVKLCFLLCIVYILNCNCYQWFAISNKQFMFINTLIQICLLFLQTDSK